MSEQGAITRGRNGYVLRLGAEERALIGRLLDELRALVTDPDGNAATSRLFPVVHRHDAEQEEEYQRLMREELVASRLAGIDVVKAVLGGQGKKLTLTGDQLSALMQAVNSVRLVLGTILDITEDDDVPDGITERVPEYQLYAYLSWLLDSAVLAASGR
jgi:hypothetical protein